MALGLPRSDVGAVQINLGPRQRVGDDEPRQLPFA